MLISYVRDAFGPFATFVALSSDQIGISICCPKDKFVKKLGVRIAEGRANLGIPVDNVIESSPSVDTIIEDETFEYVDRRELLRTSFNRMQERAKKYFKVN